MKHNKFYKFLRIVFLTLAIISMVFALFRKITHAAGSLQPSDVLGWDTSNNSIVGDKAIDLPYPYGYAGTAVYGKDDCDLTPVVEYFLNWNSSITLVTVGNAEENNPNWRWFHGWYQGYYSGNMSDVISPSMGQLNINGGRFDVCYDVENGVIVNGVNNQGVQSLSLGAFATPVTLPTGITEHYFIPKNLYIQGYPIYYAGGSPIIVNSETKFFFDNDTVGNAGGDSGDGDGFTISGHSIGSGSLDFDGFTYDQNGNITGITGGIDLDLNVDLDVSGIEDKMNDLIDGQTEISSEIIYQGNSIGGKIDGLATAQGQTNSKLEDIKGKLEDIKGKLDTARGKISDILDKIEEFFEWVTNPFDQEEFDADVDDLPLFDLVDSVKGNMQTNLASFNNTSVTDPIFVFDISGPIMGEDQTFTLDLTSYEDYKNLIVPLITMILTVTFVFSLFNDLPNLFHGKSGQDNVN